MTAPWTPRHHVALSELWYDGGLVYDVRVDVGGALARVRGWRWEVLRSKEVWWLDGGTEADPADHPTWRVVPCGDHELWVWTVLAVGLGLREWPTRLAYTHTVRREVDVIVPVGTLGEGVL